MRAAAILACAVSLACAATGPRELRHRAVGRRALAGSAVSAGVGQLRNSPHEWGRGPLGYVKRFGSHLGQHVAKESIQFGVAALRHEDLRYRRSHLQGTWPRVRYAVKSTFLVPRANKPGRTVALSRLSGNLGAGMLSRVWQPASTAGVGAGLASGGIGLGADVGANVAREFWPRKERHPRPRHVRYYRGRQTLRH